MRQASLYRNYDPRRGFSIATLAYEYRSQFLISEHAHGSDQLIYATHGLMEVRSGHTSWLIPPSFAVWVPARVRHRIFMPEAVSMRTLYIRPGLVTRTAPGCAVLSVTPLLRELIVETVRLGQLSLRKLEHRSLRDLLVMHIGRAQDMPTAIHMPRDPRALRAATMILDRLAESPPLQSICREVGISPRTLQRLFRSELGIDVISWRQQVRLTRALEFLVGGLSVKQTAFHVGYRQPSAFVAAFRKVFGLTPKSWVARFQAM